MNSNHNWSYLPTIFNCV